MAESGSVEGKFPPEIVSSDDDPSRGFYTIRLTIPGMKTKKGVFDKVATITNGDCKVQITSSDISLTAKVDVDGKSTNYSYCKKLPEDINDKNSKYKLKNEEVILVLAKTEKVSWGQYSTYFMKKA